MAKYLNVVMVHFGDSSATLLTMLKLRFTVNISNVSFQLAKHSRQLTQINKMQLRPQLSTSVKKSNINRSTQQPNSKACQNHVELYSAAAQPDTAALPQLKLFKDRDVQILMNREEQAQAIREFRQVQLQALGIT